MVPVLAECACCGDDITPEDVAEYMVEDCIACLRPMHSRCAHNIGTHFYCDDDQDEGEAAEA